MIIKIKPYREVIIIQPSFKDAIVHIKEAYCKLEGKEFTNPEDKETHYVLDGWLIHKCLCDKINN